MADDRPWAHRTLHFVGAGGAGMSGYALYAAQMGARVSGSDQREGPALARLRESGLDVAVGHDGANVPAGDDVELIHSTAVPADNPERQEAARRGLRDRPRAELLAEITAQRPTIAVAGAHGKTTTATMVAHVLRSCGMKPGFLIGAEVPAFGTNGDRGGGEWLVVEADESDRSMLSLSVDIAVVTNVELDHHATFGSLAELEDAFRAFLAGAPRAVLWRRPQLLGLAAPGAETVTFDVDELQVDDGRTSFTWADQEVRLPAPGRHNALNAAAALEAARLAGADPAQAAASLESFQGAERRFQRLGETDSGAVVYDDYAHHPTEVAATLDTARALGPGRLVAVFQPHLYSRTAALAVEFGAALARADEAVVLDVYPAREDAADFPGVDGRLVARAAAGAAAGRPVYWLPRFEDAQPVLRDLLGQGDVCLVMGAGDVDELGRRLVQ
jgi:UDP-N-acetylmuramate--alanine ligase